MFKLFSYLLPYLIAAVLFAAALLILYFTIPTIGGR